MADEITSPLRPQLLGRMTQRAVVETLRAHGPLSRADISRLTGISPTTVSSAVVQVLKAGFAEETDAEITGPGRPGKLLRLAATTTQVVGLSVTPEWCEMTTGGLDGHLHAKRHARFPTPNTYAQLLAEVERVAHRWLAAADIRTLGLGISLPGMIDPTGDKSVFSPNLHQTDNEQPGRDLAERLGLPTVLIQENDALCLAERRVHRTDDLAVIDYTGGLGVGRLIGGRLLNRHVGLPTELGHVTTVPDGEPCGCGNRGCLETVATDAAFARRVAARINRRLTADEVFAAIAADKIDPEPDLGRVLDNLAVAVAAVTNLFAPPLIVLHGRLLDLAPDLIVRLAERAAGRKLAPFRDRCRLAKAATTKSQGAVAGIIDHLFEQMGPTLPAGM
jgi:predicted NBD/HSP70 family sugar kinase